MPELPEQKSLDKTIQAVDVAQDLGDAVEDYLNRVEALGHAPDLKLFLDEYSHLGEELKSAIEGLALVKGLLSAGSASSDDSRVSGLERELTAIKPGFSLAGYRIIRELGRGGMGVVYEAVHVDLDRPVALKILRPWSGGSARRRFLNEAKTAASLHHTNIVPVFDVGQAESISYYAMQKIDGEGLDCWVRRHRGEAARQQIEDSSASHLAVKPVSLSSTVVNNQIISKASGSQAGSDDERATSIPFPATLDAGLVPKPVSAEAEALIPGTSAHARWVAQVGSQAARALDYAHRRQVIHRDIKPSNLILDAAGTIWVADFGLALRLDDPDLSRGDGVLGTPRYTSPEQAARKVVDNRTDIYSLGAALYEILTLRPPYDGQTSDEVIRKILTESLVPPRQLLPSISRDLETIIIKAMARRPEDRYATAQEMADDLERFLNFEPVRARRIGAAGRLWRMARRHPAVSAVILVAMSIISVIASIAYERVARERDDAVLARSQTLLALQGEKSALDKAHKAMRNQLWREASMVRQSAVPDRRDKVLDLIREASEYDPEPELRTKLRNEVVQALAISDVRQKEPLVGQRVAGFEVLSGGNVVASLSEDGRTLSFLDPKSGKKTGEVSLETLLGPAVLGGPGFRGGEGAPGGLLSRRSVRNLLAVSSQLGLVRPDGRSIIWLDGQNGEWRGEWQSPGQAVILAALPVGDQPKILTIEDHRQIQGERRQSSSVYDSNDELLIVLHDLDGESAHPLVLDRFKPAPERNRFVWPVLSVSPDGKWVAISRLFEDQIRILDTSDGHELVAFSAQVPISSIAAGPDRRLAVAGGGTIRIWRNDIRVQNDKESWTTVALPTLGTHLGSIRQIRFSPDGNLIAASGRTSGIELWSLRSGLPVATLPTQGTIDSMAFSNGGTQLLAAIDENRSGSLKVWSIDEPLAEEFMTSMPEQVTSFGLLEKVRNPAIISHSNLGRIWIDMPGMASPESLSLPDNETAVSCISIDRQGRFWVASGNSILRWDEWQPQAGKLPPPSATFTLLDANRTGVMNRSFGLTRIPVSMSVSAQTGRVLFSRGPMLAVLNETISPVFIPVVLADGDEMERPQPRRDLGVVQREEQHKLQAGQNDGREPRRKPGPSRGHDDAEERAVGKNLEGMVTGPGNFRISSFFTRRAMITPDGRGIVLIRGDSWEYWQIGEIQEGPQAKFYQARKMAPPPLAPVRGISAFAISGDGSRLALGSREGVVTIISMNDQRILQRFQFKATDEENAPPVQDLAFSPDGRLLAVSGRTGVVVWKLEANPVQYFHLPEENIMAVAPIWDSSGEHLYTVNDQRNILKFNISKITDQIGQIGLNY